MGSQGRQDKPFEIPKKEVWDAWKRVKANGGCAGGGRGDDRGLRGRSKGNLYKVWNRMSSGSYFPPPVRAVEIPKAGRHEDAGHADGHGIVPLFPVILRVL